MRLHLTASLALASISSALAKPVDRHLAPSKRQASASNPTPSPAISPTGTLSEPSLARSISVSSPDVSSLSSAAESEIRSAGGCEPGVVQQGVGSHYLAAQNAQGGSALVPTTSIFTTTDEIIQPQVINPTSNLPGAEVIRLQDLDICLPTYITDHFGMTVAAPAFHLTLSALENNGVADRSSFNIDQCAYLTADSTVPNPFVTVPGVIKQAALDAVAVAAYAPKVTAEPRLMAYVCDAGAANDYCLA